MRTDKFKAYKLRAQGRSYNEISKLLKIPKSTLSSWFIGLELSDEAKDRIKNRVYEKSTKALIQRNVVQTHLAEKRTKKIRDEARDSIATLKKNDLLLLGTSLYWAEGHKRPLIRKGRVITSHPVSLTNSDPKLIALFLKFLRQTCKVPDNKIIVNLRYFEHQNESYLLSYWQSLTQLPQSQFTKSYVGVSISSQRKRPYNILPYGVVQIRVSDTSLFHKIMGWIEGLSSKGKLENED